MGVVGAPNDGLFVMSWRRGWAENVEAGDGGAEVARWSSAPESLNLLHRIKANNNFDSKGRMAERAMFTQL